MKYKVILIAIFITFIFVYFSCFPVSLKKFSILEIKVNLIDLNSHKIKESIIPGDRYYASIIIYTKEGKTIKNPYLKDLIFNSPNDSIKYNIDILGRLILTFKRDYLLALYEDFILILSSKYDNVIEFKFIWAVDWYKLPGLIYKGKDGMDGINGLDGKDGEDGTASSPNGENGEDGTDGGNGENGENGKTVFFDVAYYKKPKAVKGYYNDYFIIINESISKKIYLFPTVGQITVDTSGGNGGDAGAGGKGGKGGTGYSDAPNGSSGKDGFSGMPGKGGDAGNIYINCPYNFPIYQHFNFISKGGKGGFYSFNLLFLIFYIFFPEIFQAEKGRDGSVFISNYQIEELFKFVNNDYFERENSKDYFEE